MATISYLWKNRARFPLGSKRFAKAWAKRFLLLNDLILRNYTWRRLTRSGALLADTAEICNAKVGGDLRKLQVGRFSTIGRVEVALHDRITIGSHVCINDGVKLLTASHSVSDPSWTHVKAPIEIGDYAWLATNSIILPGVKIGRGAVVGAGAVVSKEVPAYAIAVGNPMVILPKQRVNDLDYNPCASLALYSAWLNG